MQKSIVAKYITIFLYIILIIGTLLLLFIPKLYDYFKMTEILPFQEHTLLYKIAFFSCYILCLLIIFVLIKIFKLVYKGTPFKKEIVNYLKYISVIFMLLSIIILIKAIFIPTLLSFAVITITFIASLSFYCLANVFKVANYYKQEIEYTV